MLPPFPRISAALAAFLFALLASAQQNDIPLNRDIYYDIDRNGAAKSSTMHTGLRPIIESRADLHNVMGYRPDSTKRSTWIARKLFAEHLVNVKQGDFALILDPVFQFEVGKDFREGSEFSDTHLMGHNGRGFRIAADLGPTVSFQSTFYENQATLPGYLYDFSQATEVVPGQGRIKNFDTRGLDFAWAMGNVSWTPINWLNVQLGQGRHFVGNGYRSMLLSDNTFSYPYVKLSALSTNKRFSYSTIHAKLQLPGEANRLPTGDASESLFYWKHATFQYLSVNLGPTQIGFFEGTQWNNIDSSGVRPYDPLELNPVIGVNVLVNGFNGRNTELLGLDAKWKLCDKAFLYGQLATTDPQQGHYAWQAGLQWFNLFQKELHLLLEYDHAAVGTYLRTDARMSWTQYNQPLASPLGTGFSEAIAQVDYGMTPQIWLHGELSLAQWEAGGANAMGQEYDAGTQRVWTDLNVAWRMNQMTNMSIALGWTNRDLQPAITGQNSGYVHISFQTGLFNRYYDI